MIHFNVECENEKLRKMKTLHKLLILLSMYTQKSFRDASKQLSACNNNDLNKTALLSTFDTMSEFE